MVQSTFAGSRQIILMGLGVLGIIAAFIALPDASGVAAGRKSDGKAAVKGVSSHEPDLPNYDIRTDKGAFEKLALFRNTLNRSASEVADQRDDLVRGEAALKEKVPTLKIEYSPEIRTPEVIASDVTMGRAVLARSTSEKKSSALLTFLRENKGLIGASEAQVDALKLFADYKNPNGDLGFVEFSQEVNGIHVFQGAVKAAYSKNGELIRVVNNFAPGLNYGSLSGEFGAADRWDLSTFGRTVLPNLDQTLPGLRRTSRYSRCSNYVTGGADDSR